MYYLMRQLLLLIIYVAAGDFAERTTFVAARARRLGLRFDRMGRSIDVSKLRGAREPVGGYLSRKMANSSGAASYSL